ncbi:MAG: M42 family metallopeptidase [Capsulimonadales bacterium]|nr:M42 family metallopeptidase [Capsulimonadales bacterium]
MMTDAALAFLQRLLETPSPSGFEEPNATNFREYVTPFADSVTTDAMGNVIAAVNPKGSPRIMLAGHMDEIGFLIVHISDEGMCYFRGIGGHDNAVIVGQRVTIHTSRGPIEGVIGKKPIHLLTSEERGKAVEMQDLWVDIGATGGKDEVAAAGVRVGDPVTYNVGFTRLQGDRVTARAIDNRVGAWTVAEALRRVKERNPRAAVFAVATVQEEIGLRGAHTSAFGIAPQIGIAVDVTFATDFPSMDKRKVGEIKLAQGPTILRGANASRKLSDRMIAVAEESRIPFQLEATPGGTGTDANAMQISRDGMTTGLLGIPLRYMHTPCEIISLTDADHCAELMANICLAIGPEDDWTP